MAKILDLNVQDLEEILQTNTFPPDTSFEGLEEHPAFRTLFKHRNNPKLLATLLLKDKVKKTIEQTGEGQSLKQQRLFLKEKELSLKEKRVESLSAQMFTTHKLLTLVNSKLDFLISLLNKKEVKKGSKV